MRRETKVLGLAILALAASAAAARSQDPVEPPPEPAPEVESDETPDLPGKAAGEPATPAPESPEPGVQEAAAEEPAEKPAVTPPALDRSLGIDEIRAATDELAQALAGWVRLEVLGQSGAGRDIPLLTITDLSRGSPDEKPALLFAAHGPGRDEHGAEAALAIAWTVARAAAVDPAVAGLLAERTLYVAPLLDPDARAEPPGADAIAFDQGFPAGWQPARLRPGSGVVPLEKPAARVALELLEEHENIVLLLTSMLDGGDQAPRAWPGAELPAEDARVLEALVSRNPGLRAWPGTAARGGGMLDFAYQERGILAAAIREPRGLEDGAALGDWVGQSAALALQLVWGLPRLGLEVTALERLGPGLWQLDVALSNSGELPSATGLARDRRPANRLRLSLEGGRVVGRAQRTDSEESYRLIALRGPATAGHLLEEPLAGRDTRWVRFVVEAEAGGSLVVSGSSPWSGAARVSVQLPAPSVPAEPESPAETGPTGSSAESQE